MGNGKKVLASVTLHLGPPRALPPPSTLYPGTYALFYLVCDQGNLGVEKVGLTVQILIIVLDPLRVNW